MASTIKWYYDNGGSDNSPGASNDLSGGGTKLRFRTDDSGHTIDTANPIPIPTSGYNFSYWAHLYMEMTARTAETVNNMKFYTVGSAYGTGIILYLGSQDPVHTAAATTGYDLATGTSGTTGDEMITAANKHTDLTTQADAISHTSGSPRTLTIGESGSVLDAVGETCNYLVFQVSCTTTASAGAKTAITLTGRYDEV